MALGRRLERLRRRGRRRPPLCPALRRSLRSRPCLVPVALLLAALCASAHAQYWGEVSNYVTITDTSVERLSNAVRIVLKADGTL